MVGEGEGERGAQVGDAGDALSQPGRRLPPASRPPHPHPPRGIPHRPRSARRPRRGCPQPGGGGCGGSWRCRSIRMKPSTRRPLKRRSIRRRSAAGVPAGGDQEVQLMGGAGIAEGMDQFKEEGVAEAALAGGEDQADGVRAAAFQLAGAGVGGGNPARRWPATPAPGSPGAPAPSCSAHRRPWPGKPPLVAPHPGSSPSHPPGLKRFNSSVMGKKGIVKRVGWHLALRGAKGFQR